MSRLPRRIWLRVGSLVCAAVVAAALPSLARSTEPFASLASHRALYLLSLDDTRSSGALEALEGRLLWQQEAACDGMTSSQRMVTRQWAAEGAGSIFDLQLSAWESADGGEMRFAQSFRLNGNLIDESTGTAVSGVVGGMIDFETPEQKTISIEQGVVFPATMIARIIDVAKAGEHRFSAIVYEGDSDGEQFDVRVAIGDTRVAGGTDDLLKGLASWPVLISYYERGAKDELPVYEIAYRLFENSVTDDVIIDYGEYAIRAELDTLEALPEPNC